MKFDHIDITGLDRVCFERKTVWNRVRIAKGRVWVKECDENRYIPDTKMVRTIKRLHNSPRHRVWIHGTTVNIVSIPKGETH